MFFRRKKNESEVLEDAINIHWSFWFHNIPARKYIGIKNRSDMHFVLLHKQEDASGWHNNTKYEKLKNVDIQGEVVEKIEINSHIYTISINIFTKGKLVWKFQQINHLHIGSY